MIVYNIFSKDLEGNSYTDEVFWTILFDFKKGDCLLATDVFPIRYIIEVERVE